MPHLQHAPTHAHYLHGQSSLSNMEPCYLTMHQKILPYPVKEKRAAVNKLCWHCPTEGQAITVLLSRCCGGVPELLVNCIDVINCLRGQYHIERLQVFLQLQDTPQCKRVSQRDCMECALTVKMQ